MPSSLYTTPIIITSVVTSVLLVIAMRRRSNITFTLFALLLGGIFTWAVSYSLELGLESYVARVYWAKLQYLGIGTVAVFWLLFVMAFIGNEHWITPTNVILLLIEPVIVNVLVWTTEAHGLVWNSYGLVSPAGHPILAFEHGPWFWVHIAYSYTLLLISSGLLAYSFARAPQLYQGQITLMVLGSLLPWLGNFLYVLGLTPVPGLDFTPIGFALGAVVFAVALIRFRLFDILPTARAVVFENLPDPVMVFDTENRLIELNAAAVHEFGWQTRAAIGQPLDVLLSDDDENLRNLIEEGQSSSGDIVHHRREQPHWFSVQVEPIHSGNTRRGKLVVLRDTTDRVNAENAIRQQNKQLRTLNFELTEARKEAEAASRLKSQFLATMSHELRTPLNAINGFCQILDTGIAGPLTDNQKHSVERIMTNGEHLLGLVDSILDLNRIEAGNLELVPNPFILTEWVDTVCGQFAAMAEQQDLTFTHSVDDALPRILIADEVRLRQIVVNLLGNAFKFTKTGSIALDFRRHGDDEWRIVATDTGIGIPDHAIHTIFNEFEQVDGSMTRRYGGSGLGLSIVRNLVILMNGTVSVTSEAGKGSTFTVTLPLIHD